MKENLKIYVYEYITIKNKLTNPLKDIHTLLPTSIIIYLQKSLIQWKIKNKPHNNKKLIFIINLLESRCHCQHFILINKKIQIEIPEKRELCDVTCSHGAFPSESQQSFLLQYETSSDKQTGADGQSQADVEIVSASLLTHGESTFRCHIEQRAQEPSSSSGALESGQDTWRTWCRRRKK